MIIKNRDKLIAHLNKISKYDIIDGKWQKTGIYSQQLKINNNLSYIIVKQHNRKEHDRYSLGFVDNRLSMRRYNWREDIYSAFTITEIKNFFKNNYKTVEELTNKEFNRQVNRLFN